MIEEINEELTDLQKKLYLHEIYSNMNSLDDLRLFMGAHVHCVLNFMNLVKFLQNKFSPSVVPWRPPRNPVLARFINEIVIAEETDEMPNGRIISHYQMYVEAMGEVGSIPMSKDLPFIRNFNDACEKIISSKKDHEVAAAFSFGREQIIPTMFRSILKNVKKNHLHVPTFSYYIERHIDLDEDVHGPLANEILRFLCNDNHKKWDDVKRIAQDVLTSRIKLWDEVLSVMLSSRSCSKLDKKISINL